MAAASIAQRVARGRTDSPAATLAAVGGAGLVAAGLTALVCARSRVLVDPTSMAVWRGAFVATYVAIGLYAWWRRRQSRLGPLLAGAGFLYSLVSLNASADPLAYTIGTVVWAALVVYVAYVFLSFPRGRLESPLERRFIQGVAVATGAVWVLILALSPTLPVGSAFNDCGARCPPNALQLVSGHHGTGVALKAAFSAVTAISLIGLALLVFDKARSATPPARRAMAPVTVALIASTVGFAVFLVIGAVEPDTQAAFRIAGGVATLAVPVAILAGLIRGQAAAAMHLYQLALRSAADPFTPAAVQKMVGEALGDPTLVIAVWDAEAAGYVGVDGATVGLPREGEPRAVTRVTRDGWAVAALIHDPGLHTDSAVAEGLAATAFLLLENWRLLKELRASQGRLIGAAEHERQRLERDLHDGAQQSLMAIQIQAGLARDATDPVEVERKLSAIEREAEAALEELRELAHGIYPPVLHDFGLAVALRALARRTAVPVRVSDRDVGRYPAPVEAAMYFCAREAIQNAVKHAGPTATVTVTLQHHLDALHLTVKDDGVGMATRSVSAGLGVMNMRDRIEAVGGRFEVVSARGHGTSVRAEIRDPPA